MADILLSHGRPVGFSPARFPKTNKYEVAEEDDCATFQSLYAHWKLELANWERDFHQPFLDDKLAGPNEFRLHRYWLLNYMRDAQVLAGMAEDLIEESHPESKQLAATVLEIDEKSNDLGKVFHLWHIVDSEIPKAVSNAFESACSGEVEAFD